MPKNQVVFITGTGHCGSTLLDLLLGSHSLVFSMGEFRDLRDKVNKPKQEGQLCTICTGECEYWDRRVPRSLLRQYFSFNNLFADVIRRVRKYHKSIYQHLIMRFEHPILVDSTKPPRWIKSQLLLPRHWKDISPVLIYCTRDGRAVVSSYLRKYPEDSVTKRALYWKQRTELCESYFQEFAGHKMQVSYESLCQRPVQVLEDICKLLGIDFEPTMLHYWAHDHHLVGGNEGTRSLIFKYRGEFPPIEDADLNHGGRWNGDYYKQTELAIKLDLRWKRELTQQQLEEFEAVAGTTNARYAYDPEYRPQVALPE